MRVQPAALLGVGCAAGILAASAGVVVGAGLHLSPAVYPPATWALRFSHARHERVEGACLRCHGSVVSSVATRDRNLPGEATCRPCHPRTRPNDGVRESRGAGCRSCHPAYEGRGAPLRSVTPSANLRFSHRLHHERKVACSQCHDASQRALPAMSRCLTCHTRQGRPKRCVVCHLSEKDGRLRTRFPSGLLVPSGSLTNDAHTPLFSRVHGAVARSDLRYCESCHKQRSCLRCHAGTLRPISIHQGDYTRRHALDARLDQPRCSSCHRSQTFCLSCHQRLGVGRETRTNGFRPGTSLRFHPPEFSGYTRAPGHHSYSARRNIRTCSACHRESTCIRCHGTRERGRANLSPHGPGFSGSLKCRSLAARNQRVCLKCHAQGDGRVSCQ